MTPRTHKDKPYVVYRSGSAAPIGGASPETEAGGMPPASGAPTTGEKSRRWLTILLLLGIVVVVAIGAAAVAGWGPFAGSPTADGATDGGTSGAGAAASPTASALAASPSASPSADPSPPTPADVWVTAGGDVIGGFGVKNLVQSMGDELFASIAPSFQKSDFGFVNLESPLTEGGDPQSWKDVVIKGDPKLAPAMAAAGINVVTMANNHAGDQGTEGILDSIKHCNDNGIAVVGAGKDLKRAQRAAVLTTDAGAKVAFLGFSDVLPVGFPATSASAGISPGRSDLGAVKDVIKAARKKADVVIVGWHWNFEYKRAPSTLEVTEGRAAIDAGADIVFAHHPHLLNGVEEYHGGLIFYSLGNLVFSGFSGETAETIIVRTRIAPERIDAQLIPVAIDTAGKPSLAKGSAAESILQRFRRFSADLGTTVKIAGSRGYVHLTR